MLNYLLWDADHDVSLFFLFAQRPPIAVSVIRFQPGSEATGDRGLHPDKPPLRGTQFLSGVPQGSGTLLIPYFHL